MNPHQPLREQLNCQAGQLAIVTSEEPGCEANIGRCVQILHRLRETPRGPMWRARPVGDPLWVCVRAEVPPFLVDTRLEDVLVPDACLTPLAEADGRATPRAFNPPQPGETP